jgi:hypothetical protein
LGVRWHDRLFGELELIGDIIEIERAKHSIREVAFARALRAVWRVMSRRKREAPMTGSGRARR